jgi:hypothetical protein
MPTAKDVAQWMLAEVRKGDWLHQEVIVHEIESAFGEDFVYVNQNGNQAISKDVLKEFRSVSGQEVVWERGERAWRLRTAGDAPSRQQE